MNIELIERLAAVHKQLVENSGAYASQASAGRYVDTGVADNAIKGILGRIEKETRDV